MGHPVALLPSPVPLARRQCPKQNTLGEVVFFSMRITKPAKHSLGLRTVASMVSAAGSKKGLSVGQGVVRTFPHSPTDAPREEQAVSPVELGVVVHRRAPRGALVEEPLHHLGLE